MKYIFQILLGAFLLVQCNSAQQKASTESTTKIEEKTPATAVPIYASFDEMAHIFEYKNDTTYIINFWATWCKPCIVDMERSKAKKALLKQLPVEIIYLAISDGSSPQKWEQTINKLQVSGQHIYIEKDLTAALLKQFNLFGYPSYIFIDRNGNWDTNFVRSISNIDLDKIGAKL